MEQRDGMFERLALLQSRFLSVDMRKSRLFGLKQLWLMSANWNQGSLNRFKYFITGQNKMRFYINV